MNLLTLVALLTLSLIDPSGDAIGDGTLEPPTSPIYANAAQFDLLGVELHSPELLGSDGAAASRLTIAMGSLPTRDSVELSEEDAAGAGAFDVSQAEAAGHNETFDLSSLLAVIDVYIDTGDGGADRTLAGPNMLMPLGHGWRHALRISADGVMAVSYSDVSEVEQGGVLPVSLDPADSAAGPVTAADATTESSAAVDAAAESSAAESLGGKLTVEWLSVTRSGNDLVVELPWAFEGEVELYALTGVHDPFSSSGWRQLSQQPSPWAFSGDSQVSPVIDLLAPDADRQAAALASGVLPLPPREQTGFTLPRTPWPYLMIAGLLLAVAGLVMRGRVPADRKVVAAAVAATAHPSTDQEATGETVAGAADAAAVAEVPPPGDDLPPVDEPAPADAVVVAGNEATTDDNALGEATSVAADREPSEIILVRDEPASTPEQVAVNGPPAAAELGRPRSRTLVASEVERSYLGADASGFEVEADEDELDESFWHPRSRKPTLTEVNSGVVGAHKAANGKPRVDKVGDNEAGDEKVGVRDPDAPGSG